MKTPSVTHSTAREQICCYCGVTDEPMKGKDLRSAGSGYAWRLASSCIDAHACSVRAKARDAHMDERWTLRPAGRTALAFIEQAEQLPLPPAA
jgi:hypothetical protein